MSTPQLPGSTKKGRSTLAPKWPNLLNADPGDHAPSHTRSDDSVCQEILKALDVETGVGSLMIWELRELLHVNEARIRRLITRRLVSAGLVQRVGHRREARWGKVAGAGVVVAQTRRPAIVSTENAWQWTNEFTTNRQRGKAKPAIDSWWTRPTAQSRDGFQAELAKRFV